MSSNAEDFDFEATLQTLGALADTASAEQRAALELAANALHFLYVTNQLPGLRDYVRDAEQPVVLSPHAFDDMTQATAWLHTQPSPAHGMLVKVAGRTYAVWRDEAGQWVLVPSRSPEELAKKD